MVSHDLSMRILYQCYGWLIFARVIVLFMLVWSPYVRPHILCTQLVICLLSHFIHIWYLGWPWSEHAHIIPISQMVDFCESYSPFHVCLTICPFAHLVYATSHLSFVAFYWYLVSWLAMNLSMCILYWFHGWLDFARVIALFMFVCLTIRPSAHLVYATSHLSFVAFYSYLVNENWFLCSLVFVLDVVHMIFHIDWLTYWLIDCFCWMSIGRYFMDIQDEIKSSTM